MPGEVLSGGGNVLESFGELEQRGDTGAIAVEEGAPAPSWGGGEGASPLGARVWLVMSDLGVCIPRGAGKWAGLRLP